MVTAQASETHNTSWHSSLWSVKALEITALKEDLLERADTEEGQTPSFQVEKLLESCQNRIIDTEDLG